MDWTYRRLRRELERVESIVRVVMKYLELKLLELGYIRRCFKHEELRPFKIRRNCVPIKSKSFCVDLQSRRVFVTFVDDRYRCYVIVFLRDKDFGEFVERLCKLYSNSCRIYSFCSCS